MAATVRREEGFFSAHDNLRLFHESILPEAPRAHVGVVHGYMEHVGRHRWVLEKLAEQGFGAHGFDYRGHGQADGRRSHVDKFEDYLEDLQRFWERLRRQSGGKKTFLLAHSHGGLMAIRWARRKPEGLAGLVLSAPYLKLAFKPPRLKIFGAQLAGAVVPWMPVKQELKPSELTRDPEAQEKVARDPLYNRVVTPRWFKESGKAQVEAVRSGPEIDVPVFMFCGSADPIASPWAVRTFFETLASRDKKFREYPERVHEPLNDLGKDEVLADVCSWLNAHL